jgi:hypothetical protein
MDHVERLHLRHGGQPGPDAPNRRASRSLASVRSRRRWVHGGKKACFLPLQGGRQPPRAPAPPCPPPAQLPPAGPAGLPGLPSALRSSRSTWSLSARMRSGPGRRRSPPRRGAAAARWGQQEQPRIGPAPAPQPWEAAVLLRQAFQIEQEVFDLKELHLVHGELEWAGRSF